MVRLPAEPNSGPFLFIHTSATSSQENLLNKRRVRAHTSRFNRRKTILRNWQRSSVSQTVPKSFVSLVPSASCRGTIDPVLHQSLSEGSTDAHVSCSGAALLVNEEKARGVSDVPVTQTAVSNPSPRIVSPVFGALEIETFDSRSFSSAATIARHRE